MGGGGRRPGARIRGRAPSRPGTDLPPGSRLSPRRLLGGTGPSSSLGSRSLSTRWSFCLVQGRDCSDAAPELRRLVSSWWTAPPSARGENMFPPRHELHQRVRRFLLARAHPSARAASRPVGDRDWGSGIRRVPRGAWGGRGARLGPRSPAPPAPPIRFPYLVVRFANLQGLHHSIAS